MNAKPILQSQYLAALEMLKQVIVLCPAASWDAPGDKSKFWNKAYHALFYAHLYLQESEKHFQPWEKHHDPDTGAPFSQAEMLEYLGHCPGAGQGAGTRAEPRVYRIWFPLAAIWQAGTPVLQHTPYPAAYRRTL